MYNLYINEWIIIIVINSCETNMISIRISYNRMILLWYTIYSIIYYCQHNYIINKLSFKKMKLILIRKRNQYIYNIIFERYILKQIFDHIIPILFYILFIYFI